MLALPPRPQRHRMVTDKKRPRDGNDQDDASESSGAAAGQGAKRRRVGAVGFGLGTFAGLVGKAFKATASVFRGGEGGGRRSM